MKDKLRIVFVPFVPALAGQRAGYTFLNRLLSVRLGIFNPKRQTKSVLRATVVFIGINLLVGIVTGIDNAAHIGGLLCGFLFGFAFLASCKGKMIKTKPNYIIYYETESFIYLVK